MRLVVALLEAKVRTGCCDPSLLSSSIAVLPCSRRLFHTLECVCE